MKNKLIILLAGTIILFGCESNSAKEKTNTLDSKNISSEKTDQASDNNLSGTQGIFSYTVKSQHVVARNYVQHSNLFINEVTNDAAAGTLKIKVTCETSSVFDFQVANSGSTTITNYSPSLGNFADKKTKVASYMEGGTYKSYYGDSVTVTITSMDANRVSGTFSGTFKAEAEDGGATLSIREGSFNLPFGKN